MQDLYEEGRGGERRIVMVGDRKEGSKQECGVTRRAQERERERDERNKRRLRGRGRERRVDTQELEVEERENSDLTHREGCKSCASALRYMSRDSRRSATTLAG